MKLKVVVTCLAVILFFFTPVDLKSVTKQDVQDQEEKQEQSVVKTVSEELQGSGAGKEEEDTVDCDEEKLKKCNILCKKSKAVEKRSTHNDKTCECSRQMCKNEDPEKRRKECDEKTKCDDKTRCKKCASHFHATGGKKEGNCTCSKKASSPVMQRVFSFPAIMIAPIKGYNTPEKEVQGKKGTASKKCCCHDCCCCCCEPCCCCHECCCCPCCCCCCEPCCCCCDCHHCCHHCCDHCCDHCCCKKSGAQGAIRPGPQGGK
ncbi:uncharacterized protein LOC116292266 [Actinia tenebrosa]|uniref:Uncharacterized protein LOC116292266 n=1 Tax=Actinia tenebrosa TaxID=6105 RepID=A0A6P8HKJ0_ACTTE|nr:uncharacterized protein LOC116292266 [Actinia tenebrosa]